jgi:hypothetical protein
MSALSDYAEVEVRKHFFRTGSFTKPTTLRVALCTSATSDAQTGATITEVANSGSYARTGPDPLDANWTGASSTDGLTDNASAITFPTASGSWGTVTHIGIVDSATWGAGNLLIHGALTASKTVASGDVFQFAAGALDVTFA